MAGLKKREVPVPALGSTYRKKCLEKSFYVQRTKNNHTTSKTVITLRWLTHGYRISTASKHSDYKNKRSQ